MMNPHINIISDVAANDIILIAECTSGQNIQLCAGGTCEMGKEITKTGVTLEAGKSWIYSLNTWVWVLLPMLKSPL